jgi:hypothetical protein
VCRRYVALKKDRGRPSLRDRTAISAGGSGICYAGALCFAVRLVLLRAKVTPQDSSCRYENYVKAVQPSPVNPLLSSLPDNCQISL